MNPLSPAGGPTGGPGARVRARIPVTLGRTGRHPAELVTFRGLPGDDDSGDGDSGGDGLRTGRGGREHLACLLPGRGSDPPLVRLHSECLTGDVFGSTRCDCGPQLDEAVRRIAEEGGAVLYLRQEGRGIGLYNKLDAYLLQDGRTDTFEANRLLGRGADEREYATAAAMLCALGLHRIRLLTNNPDKVRQLTAHGVDVAEAVPTEVHLTSENAAYLAAKANRGGHTLALPAVPAEVPG